jgi:cell division septation protein DedD
MNIDRIVGLVFSIAALLLILFVVLSPQIEYQTEFSKINSDELIEISEQESPTKITSSLAESPNNQINIDTKVSDIKESDFDVFVLRVHVLSSKENALRIVEKVKESGFPAFTEVFGSKKNLYAVYVGPFISQDDIKLNLEQIEKIAESSSGEIIKWKL